VREWRARRAWNALGRCAETRRVVHLAAACGVAAFSAAGAAEGAARMRRLLEALVAAERGDRRAFQEGGER
jgi:hypothetical protein